MINEKDYFSALDRAIEALEFNPYDPDANNYTSFFWGLMTCAYTALVQPVVSHLPRKAAMLVDEALQNWADGKIEAEDDITAHAQKKFEKWFNGDFLSLWRNAALESRVMLSHALEEHMNSHLTSEGFPGVSLGLFSMRETVKAMEKELVEQALPFMLHEIFSYEFVELDDNAPDRAAILREGSEALKSERDFRLGLERATLAEALVTDESIFSFAKAVIRELGGQAAAIKCGSIAAAN